MCYISGSTSSEGEHTHKGAVSSQSRAGEGTHRRSRKNTQARKNTESEPTRISFDISAMEVNRNASLQGLTCDNRVSDAI